MMLSHPSRFGNNLERLPVLNFAVKKMAMRLLDRILARLDRLLTSALKDVVDTSAAVLHRGPLSDHLNRLPSLNCVVGDSMIPHVSRLGSDPKRLPLLHYFVTSLPHLVRLSVRLGLLGLSVRNYAVINWVMPHLSLFLVHLARVAVHLGRLGLPVLNYVVVNLPHLGYCSVHLGLLGLLVRNHVVTNLGVPHLGCLPLHLGPLSLRLGRLSLPLTFMVDESMMPQLGRLANENGNLLVLNQVILRVMSEPRTEKQRLRCGGR